MRIAIYSTEVKEEHIQIYKRIFNFFDAHQIEYFIFEGVKNHIINWLDLSADLKTFNDKTDKNFSADFILSVGGDGTFLSAVTFAFEKSVPIAGINCGRLGFLAEITPEDLEESLNQLVNSEYEIEFRSLLKLIEPSTLFEDFNYAMNELTVHKLDNSSMIRIETFINGEFLANYWADGLIVSTPTGSTAYSLSVGGPIVTPNVSGLIITPIASHHLTVRPIVVPDDVEIELRIDGRGHQFLLSIDHHSSPLDFSSSIKIRKADKMVPVVKFNGQSFYSTLRNKLMWGADKRN